MSDYRAVYDAITKMDLSVENADAGNAVVAEMGGWEAARRHLVQAQDPANQLLGLVLETTAGLATMADVVAYMLHTEEELVIKMACTLSSMARSERLEEATTHLLSLAGAFREHYGSLASRHPETNAAELLEMWSHRERRLQVLRAAVFQGA